MARKFGYTPNKYLEADSAVLSATPLTMACWFYALDAIDKHYLMCIGSSTVKDAFMITAWGVGAGDPLIALTSHADSIKAASTITGFSADTWHHACGVFGSPTSRSIFIDGGSKATNTSSSVPENLDRTGISIEIWGGAYYNPIDGRVAEAAIWNAALTDAEIAILAAGYAPTFVRPQNLVFYVPLVRDNDEDIVGGLSLTANGSPTIATHPPMIYPASPIFYGGAAVGGYTLTADQGSYSLSGQVASPLADRKIAADQGTYSLTGQAAALLRGYLVAAAQGSYSLSGQDAGLLADRLIAAAQGSYSLTGQDADLLLGHLLTADQGSYSLTGQATNLLFGRLLSATQGSYTLSGQDANLLIARLLTATQGSYTLTGQAVTLTYTPVGGYTIVAESGSYALSGQAVSLLTERLLTADQGSYALSGQATEILKGFYISAAQGSYTLTGQAASLLVDYVIALDQGSYTLTGFSSSLDYSGVVTVRGMKDNLHRLRYDRINALGRSPSKRYNRLRGRPWRG